MPIVTVDYYGVSGSGRNVSEAKRNAGSKIQFLMRHRKPAVYSHRGESVVIWYTEEGAAYSMIHADSDGGIFSTCLCDDRRVVESAVRHLLTNTRSAGEMSVPSWATSLIDVKDLLSDWRRSDLFNAAYRHAAEMPADQLPAGGVHQWACDNMDQFSA